MFCKKCGKGIKDGAVFCEFCGASQVAPAPVPDAQTSEGEAPKKRRKQKGKKKGKIGTIVAVLFVVLAILAFVGSPKDSASDASAKTTVEETTEAAIEISATKLVKAYIDNEVKADTLYDGKTVIINGRVNRIEQTDYMLMKNELIVYVGTGEDIESCLRCYISAEQKDVVAELEAGDKIAVTGRCAGIGSAYFNLKCVNIYDCVISE